MDYQDLNRPDVPPSSGQILIGLALAAAIWLLVVYLALGPYAAVVPRWLGAAR